MPRRGGEPDRAGPGQQELRRIAASLSGRALGFSEVLGVQNPCGNQHDGSASDP